MSSTDMRRLRRLSLILPAALLAPGCVADDGAGDGESGDGTEEVGDEGDSFDDDGGEGEESGETGSEPESSAGSCDYVSVFTQSAECREYTGSGWTGEAVIDDCEALYGVSALDAFCSTQDVLGRCVTDGGTPEEVKTVIYGFDADSCEVQAVGCETFGGGEWVPEPICDGTGNGGGGSPFPTFTQPTLECVDPLPGEAPGTSADGQVCTWQMIGGATEPGRQFEDYASCEVVYTQRPYYYAPPNTAEPAEDPRMEDPTYVAELDWVKEQVEASGCVCCHSDVAPNGPGNWTVDALGNWTDTFYDSGLAFAAGWIDSSAFGAYPAEDNNGFDRDLVGIPSTDPERMLAFFEAELAHRGRTKDEFEGQFAGGPLHTQRLYEPTACEGGEGVDADGTIKWGGGLARYVYVLEAGSENPTVPPNLDLPEGTVWRVDVPEVGDPIGSGTVSFGEVPAGTSQRFPAEGAAPTPLVPGQDYYLYVSRDVIQPITRCIFTYEG